MTLLQENLMFWRFELSKIGSLSLLWKDPSKNLTLEHQSQRRPETNQFSFPVEYANCSKVRIIKGPTERFCNSACAKWISFRRKTIFFQSRTRLILCAVTCYVLEMRKRKLCVKVPSHSENNCISNQTIIWIKGLSITKTIKRFSIRIFSSIIVISKDLF